jgi:succinyl-CoA synthetase beta subunit
VKKLGRTDAPQYGIGVPNGEVAKTAEEAEAIAKKLGMQRYRKT